MTSPLAEALAYERQRAAERAAPVAKPTRKRRKGMSRAQVVDLLPAGDSDHGLAAVPERYRLQLLLFAAARHASPAKVTALADRVAGRLEVPEGRTDEVDTWFRDHAQDIWAMFEPGWKRALRRLPWRR